MSDRNNILIICRDLKSAHALSGFTPQSESRYILASDDPRVHEEAGKHRWIGGICWIEQMESFYNVADDVIRVTEAVNEWLKTLADDRHGFPEELLFFMRHVEGGMTTQRIQDLLLLIRSYRSILETHEITGVMIMRKPGMGWEDDVLIEVCRCLRIDIRRIGCRAFGALIENMRSIVLVYARAACYAANVLRIKLRNRFQSGRGAGSDREVIFQLCSSAYKHVENIVPLMRALEHRGYSAVALCWHSDERYTTESGARQIRMSGLQAEELERFCSVAAMWRSLSHVFWTWRMAKRKMGAFLAHSGLNYQSVSLGMLLWPSIRGFVIAELGQSYRLRVASGEYFKSHVPLAIKLWGGAALRAGHAVWKSLESRGCDKPVVFEYWIGAAIEWPYRIVDPPADLVFVAGEHHSRALPEKCGIPRERIIVTGQARYEHVADFKRKFGKIESRAYLKIPAAFSTHILFDSNMILRGFMAPREQAVTLNVLLRVAGENPSVALLIKPHPSHRSGLLEDMLRSRRDLENVFLIDKDMPPYHALNAADMLITKFSTLGVEAMLFNCPVMCCILDGEQRFNIYEGAAGHVDRVEDLEELLIKLATNKDFRQEWRSGRLQRQETFLAEYFCEIEESPSVHQARVLGSYLETHITDHVSGP